MLNEFLVYWPIICGNLSGKENQGKFSECLMGTSTKILASIMKSLGIKGFNEGSSGNPLLIDLHQGYHLLVTIGGNFIY